VPNQAGQISIPAIEIEWWDTVNNRMQTSRLPSKTFKVVAGNKVNQISEQPPNINSSIVMSSDSNNNGEIATITRWSLGLNALLIALLVGLFYWRKTPVTITAPRTPKSVITAKQQLKKIEELAANNQLAEMRDSLLHWGAEVFQQQPPRSLNQLADLMANSELKQQFDVLDQGLFKTNSSNSQKVDAALIIKCLKDFNPIKNTLGDRGTALKSLYPNQK
jgi:hypothetical protein